MSEPLQHSPGPWTFDEWDFTIASEHAVIATFASDDLPSTIDGRVMAAAPDMLRLLRVFAVPVNQLRRLSDGELRAALEETAQLVSRLDGGE